MGDFFIFLFEHFAPQIKREDILINSGMWHRFLKKRGTDEMKMKKKKENLQELLESWMCIIWWSGLGGGGGVPRKLFGFGIIQTLESASVFRVYFTHTVGFFLFQEMFILTKGSIIIIC